mgnify:CR=1 FL=1
MSAINGTSNINELPNESTKNNVVMNIESKNNLMPQQQIPNHLQQQMQVQQQQSINMPQNQIQPQTSHQMGYNPNQQQQMQVQQQQQMPVELSSSAVNTLVTGLSNTNNTNLPVRDIPQDQQQFTHDQQIQPNYIPEEYPRNYIEEEEINMEDMILQNRKKEEEQSNIDYIYDEFQYPILAMIIYFSSQLPYLNKVLLKYLPSIFTKDHELKFTGYLFKTLTFGILFYSSIYFTRYLSEIE